MADYQVAGRDARSPNGRYGVYCVEKLRHWLLRHRRECKYYTISSCRIISDHNPAFSNIFLTSAAWARCASGVFQHNGVVICHSVSPAGRVKSRLRWPVWAGGASRCAAKNDCFISKANISRSDWSEVQFMTKLNTE